MRAASNPHLGDGVVGALSGCGRRRPIAPGVRENLGATRARHSASNTAAEIELRPTALSRLTPGAS